MLELKKYQCDALDELERLFDLTHELGDVEVAFIKQTKRPYKPIS